jgi:hydroxymethylbilane synthase
LSGFETDCSCDRRRHLRDIQTSGSYYNVGELNNRETNMKIGTRGSELATTQTNYIGTLLQSALDEQIEITIIQTQGDRVTDRPLRELEGRGYFTKEIEEALLAGKIDMAVHSFKDMPSQSPEGLTVAAISEREDPADLLIMRSSAFDPAQGRIPLKPYAVTGTSAVRRSSQISAMRSDLITRDLRGNVPTRIAKLARGEYDAIFLASAGVRRLEEDLSSFKVVRLEPEWFVPSPGQGALAVQMRSDDPRLSLVRAKITHDATSTATLIERRLQARFGGGCGLPLGAYAHHVKERWHVYGFWGGDARAPRWDSVQGTEPDSLADELFTKLSSRQSCAAEY